MELKHFQALSQVTQREVAMKKGVLLAERKLPEFTILLYQLDGFYAELYYHPQTNEVAWVKSFSCTSELEPYLSAIELPDFNN